MRNLWPFNFGKKSGGPGTPFSSATLAQLLASVMGGGATKSGASVNTNSALQVSTVLACARVIAEGVAQVSWRVMQESPDGRTRLPAKAHPLFDLLHRKPNRWQTSFAFRETLIFHILLGPQGTAYAFRSRVGSNQRLAELVLLDPHRVKETVSDSGDITYTITGANGSSRQATQADIWRIPGPSWTGTSALPLIRLAREAIGLAMAAEETQAQLHANGVRTSGTYSVEGALKAEQYEDLKAWIGKEFAGATKAGQPFILDRNAKWTPLTMTGVDAQHLETRRHQVEEVCRAFRVLPVMAMQSDKAATYASAEQMFIAHLVHTLLPWYERIEQSADCDLLTNAERAQGYYTLLEPAGMLRGSLKDTAEYISKLTERGVLTRNEGREMLDRNPIDGLDEPLTPSNMITSATNDPAGAAA
jgi:HK97 family phage portal protein